MEWSNGPVHSWAGLCLYVSKMKECENISQVVSMKVHFYVCECAQVLCEPDISLKEL